jgi:hypothetical protein
MTSSTAMAFLCLGVVALLAAVCTAALIGVCTRTAVP